MVREASKLHFAETDTCEEMYRIVFRFASVVFYSGNICVKNQLGRQLKFGGQNTCR